MKITNPKIIFFPIDTVMRELDWQLMIACQLSKLGIVSIIGHKQFIQHAHEKSKNCIWFGRLGASNGRSEGDLRILNYGNENNTHFLFLHDEGAFFSNKNYINDVEHVHPYEMMEESDNFKMLTWGKYQADALLKLSGKHNLNIRVIGMPRFDLYLKQYDWLDQDKVARIHDKYGNFILINTKFVQSNSNEYNAGSINKRHTKTYTINQQKEINDCFDNWQKVNENWASFVKMLSLLFLAYPSKKFIIRAHPSEDSTFYENVFGHYTNVKIIRQGDARPWIKACEAIVHSGCTTGFEAILAGKKVINYMPAGIDSDFNISIAEEAGALAVNPQQVIEYLNTDVKFVYQSFSEIAKQKLLNISSPSIPLALELIEQTKTSSNPAVCVMDNLFTNKLKLLKYRYYDNIKLKKSRGLNSAELGRDVRLNDLPSDTIIRQVKNFNKEYNAQVKIKAMDKNHVIIS
jgi:surface carbohydrate biosynthesis protein